MALALCACDVSGTTTTYQPYTAVFVDPSDFRGGVVCGDTAGTMRSYVATLIDVTRLNEQTGAFEVGTVDDEVIVASSPPISCRQPATFSQIVPGHYYRAEIDAYVDPACTFRLFQGSDGSPCLAPIGAPDPGPSGDDGGTAGQAIPVDPAERTTRSGWDTGARAQLRAPGDGTPPQLSALVDPPWTTRCGQVGGLPVGQAGQGGASGSAGQGGVAGQSGVAGQGGVAGQSGVAGQGGSAGQGGVAGQSGSAGQGGGADQGGVASVGGTAGAGGEQSGAAGVGAPADGGEAGQSSGSSGQGEASGAASRGYDASAPTEAVFQVTARIGGCVPLAPLTGPAGALLRADTLKGGLECGSDPGKVARFEVTLEGAATRTIDCGEEPTFENLAPGAVYRWQVLAYESGSSPPRWGSRCSLRATAGLTLPAACDPPSERGSLRLPGETLCAGGAVTYRASVVGSTGAALTRGCPGDLLLSDQLPGPVDVLVERRGAGGVVLGTATCSAQVVPGQTTAVVCAL